MFRIRRIDDDSQPINNVAIGEVQRILHEQFSGVSVKEIAALGQRLRNPFGLHFRAVLFVAENAKGRVLGFALLFHEPEQHFCYLDYLATAPNVRGRGVGAALYEQVRDQAKLWAARGLFFECLPDDPEKCRDPLIRKQNAQRLRFYEEHGARPIVGTAYETPFRPDETDNLPHLVYDGLDANRPLERAFAQNVVRTVLERKYAHLCSPEYIVTVTESFRDDPVQIRPPRYPHRPATAWPVRPEERIALVVTQRHKLHHVRERGYVESPVRIKSITDELDHSGLITPLPAREYPLEHILAVHDAEFVDYLQRACANVPEGKLVYPYVFPVRNATRPPRELSIRAGYFCIDTFTPLHRNAFAIAQHAVDCTLAAADAVVEGRRLAYALVRPPGHHAEHRTFGGFCYLNNAAIAAHYLSARGKVAILDVDYHHGNGQQEIFFARADVQTISIHAAPDIAYPYFTGFADERGSGVGEGYNLNFPLQEIVDGAQYRDTLAKALRCIEEFAPTYLIVALGLDTAKGDPTGTWLLTAKDLTENGRLIGRLGLPTLVVQEGGYRTRTLGANARGFLSGLISGAFAPRTA